MPTYAIGDIQGCFSCFKRLLSHIGFDMQQDKLYLVGDLVNRGPASFEVLSFCFEYKHAVKIVLGNHDISLLMAWQGLLKPRESDTFAQVLDNPKADTLLQWLKLQPLMLIDEATKTFISHAGLYPFWTIKQAVAHSNLLSHLLATKDLKSFLPTIYGKSANRWSNEVKIENQLQFICNAFTLMRYISSDGDLEFKHKGSAEQLSDDVMAWFMHPALSLGQYQVVFGHWAALRGHCSNSAVQAIDTGCVWGGELTALRLEDNQRFAVDCHLEKEKE